MAENWLEQAKNAVKADASTAYFMCEETSKKQQVNFWWVVEVFKKEFARLASEEEG